MVVCAKSRNANSQAGDITRGDEAPRGDTRASPYSTSLRRRTRVRLRIESFCVEAIAATHAHRVRTMKQVTRAATTRRAVSYLRVSTDEQADSGLGLESQERAIAVYCEAQGWERGPVHRDEGRSGSLPVAKRRGLLEALADLAPGDQLLVAKRDRLGRDPILVALIEREIEAKGCRLASVAGEGTEGDDPGSILIRRIVDAVAENHRLVTKVRTREAHAVKRSRGEWLGSTPFGYRAASFRTVVSRKTGVLGPTKVEVPATIEPCPVEQAQIAEMHALRRAGLSVRAIARSFNDRGVPRARPGSWGPSSICRILKAHPKAPNEEA